MGFVSEHQEATNGQGLIRRIEAFRWAAIGSAVIANAATMPFSGPVGPIISAPITIYLVQAMLRAPGYEIEYSEERRKWGGIKTTTTFRPVARKGASKRGILATLLGEPGQGGQ